MEIGFGEIVFIAILVVILYGKRLPEVSHNLGKMLYNFKKSYEEAKHGLTHLTDEQIQPAEKKWLLPNTKTADNTDKPMDESELPYDKDNTLAG